MKKLLKAAIIVLCLICVLAFASCFDGDNNLPSDGKTQIDDAAGDGDKNEEPEVIRFTDSDKFVWEATQDEGGYILSGLADGFDVAEVTVPAEYNGKPVTEIKESVFSRIDIIESVDLSHCSELEKIGSHNFSYCYNLASVSLKDCAELTEIGDSCFSILPKLVSADLRGLSTLEAVGSRFFNGYDSQSSDKNYIPTAVIDFTDCISLKRIGQMSFWYLDEVKTLDFSKTKLDTVDRQVIMGCPKLERVALPATLDPDKIAANHGSPVYNLSEFIYECDGLKEITVDPLSIYLCEEGGVLYDIDKTTVFKYTAKSKLTEFIAPDTVTKVKSRAFMNAENLTEIDFTECTLTEINFNAFYGCSNATLKVAFDEYGYNQNGAKVVCGNNWKYGVKATEYGARYFFFDFAISGIVDGSEVYASVLTVSASAKYGDGDCVVTVGVNGALAEKEDGKYKIALTEGENTVIIKAEFDGKHEERSYTVTYVNAAPVIVTPLDKESLNSSSESDFSFTIQLKVLNALQELAANQIKIEIDNCGYHPNPISVTQTDNKTVTVTMNYEQLLYPYFLDVDKEHDLKITVTLASGDRAEAIYRMIYEG